MPFLNLLKKYLIDSEIFVSLCGTLLAVYFMLEQQLLRWPTVLLIFITYWSGYLYTRYQNSAKFNKVLIFNAFCGIAAALLIFLNHNEIRLLKWLVIVVLGLLYNSRFLENFIRKIPLVKVFYVGFTWALINSWLILPAFHLPIFMISWLFVTALVLPFDIRDMDDDDVVTFPKLIGVQKTKYFAYILIFSASILAAESLKFQFAAAFFYATVVTFALIYRAENSNRDTYFSFWVELCSALPFLYLILLDYF